MPKTYLPSVFRNPQFRWLFLGRTISTLGNSISPVALTFGILQHGGGPTEVGIILAVEALPSIVLTIFGGVLADRVRRGPIMVWANVAALISQTVMAILFVIGETNTLVLAVLAAITGASFSFFLPAVQGVISQTVDDEDLHAATAWMRLAQNSFRVIGPAIGGLVVVLWGAGFAIAIDALTFLIAAVAFAQLGVEQPLRRVTGLVDDLREGWLQFWGRTWLWVLVLQYGIVNVLWAAVFQVLAPAQASRLVDGSVAWGIVLSALAVGLIAGSVVAVRFRPGRPLLWATIGTATKAVPLLAIALSADTAVVAVCAFVAGVGTEIFIVNFYATMQLTVPEEHIGRVSSYDILFGIVLLPFGYLIASPAEAVFGYHSAMMVSSVLILVSCLGVLSVKTIRASLPIANKEATSAA